MRSWTYAAVCAAVLTFARAQSPKVKVHAPTSPDAPGRETEVHKTSLRGSSGTSPEGEIAELKQQIIALKTDKKGLTIAVRRLLKANQTEAQKTMMTTLRRAKLKADEASKQLTDVESTDHAQIAKLEKESKEMQEKLNEEIVIADAIKHKDHADVAAGSKHEADIQEQLKKNAEDMKTQNFVVNQQEQQLAKNAADMKQQAASITSLRASLDDGKSAGEALRKNGEMAGTEREKLHAEIEQMKDQNQRLEEETKGLQSTVSKLWNANPSMERTSLMKMLDEEGKQVKELNSNMAAEKTQFAQEKSDLSWKLTDAQLKQEGDRQALEKLTSENKKLKADGAKTELDLKEQNKKLAVAILKERKKAAEEVQAAKKTLTKLQAQIKYDQFENHEAQLRVQKLTAATVQSKNAIDKMRLDKDSDEHVLAQELIDLQRKVNETNVIVAQKEDDLEKVKAKGKQFFSKQWDETEAVLKEHIASLENKTAIFQAKIADLTLAEKQKDSQISKFASQQADLRDVVKQQQVKLTYAVDKENTLMAHDDQLEAEKKSLRAALTKEQEIEPKMKEVLNKDDLLQTQNHRLVAAATADEEQLKKIKAAATVVSKKFDEQQSQLSFAVEQENTEMLAVKMLQGENQKLKEGLGNQTELQAQVQQVQYDAKAKVAQINVLNTNLSQSDAQIFALKEQVQDLTRARGALQDQYNSERTKVLGMADQDSTQSLALKVLQGENEKLKQQMQDQQVKSQEVESALSAATQDTQEKAAAASSLEDDKGSMQREMNALRVQQDALQVKNDQLQSTVVSMAAKRHDEDMAHKFDIAPRQPVHVEQVVVAGNLDDASANLDSLMSQLKGNNEAEQAKMQKTVAEEDPFQVD